MASAGDLDLRITTDLAGDGSITSIRAIIDDIREDKGVILAIGKKSHGEKNGRAALKSEHDQLEWECNWIVSLFVTGDHSEIEAVCRTASRYVEDVTSETPTDHDRLDPGKKKHHVFAMVYRDVKYTQSYPKNLIQGVNGYLSRNNQPKFYIGITSGPDEDAIPAMRKRRTGDKYKDLIGINRMIAIFKSRHQDECRKEEEKLIEHYRGNENNMNRTGGGGGRPTTQPWSFVYLGMNVETD